MKKLEVNYELFIFLVVRGDKDDLEDYIRPEHVQEMLDKYEFIYEDRADSPDVVFSVFRDKSDNSFYMLAIYGDPCIADFDDLWGRLVREKNNVAKECFPQLQLNWLFGDTIKTMSDIQLPEHLKETLKIYFGSKKSDIGSTEEYTY